MMKLNHMLLDIAQKIYAEERRTFGEEQMREVERVILLKSS